MQGALRARRLVYPLAAIALVLALSASAQIYRHVDAFGNVTLTNLPPPGMVETETRVPNAGAPAAADETPAKRAPTPSSFPRISSSQQRKRDVDRRAILEDEFKYEQRQLGVAQANKDFEAEKRHASNLASLARELAAIK